MGDKTTIEWTDATFNPWWGCTRISPGCDNCYAARDALRFFPEAVLWDTKTRRVFGDKHWAVPLAWNARAEKAGKRMRVFCASMADVFDNSPGLEEEREKLWPLIRQTPWLDWQILTKRVGNVARMVPTSWLGWWPPHVWLGISVVDQVEADRDIPKLLELPVRIRWLSCEPLLGPVSVGPYLTRRHIFGFDVLPGIEWVVAGGESGTHARPMHPDWARHIRNQCNAARVPFLFKQWGEWAPGQMAGKLERSYGDGTWSWRAGKHVAGRVLDGRTWDEYPQ